MTDDRGSPSCSQKGNCDSIKTKTFASFKDPLSALLDEDEEFEVDTTFPGVRAAKRQEEEHRVNMPKAEQTNGKPPPESTKAGDIDDTLLSLKLCGSLSSDVPDLSVTVDSAEKHVTALESFVTFRVNTQTTRVEFDNHEFSVRRRYSDFLWLRQQLEQTHPTHLIPPLPEKHRMRQLDKFSQEFVEVRRAALEKFLSRLAEHPVLSFDENFKVFLTAKQWEFQVQKKQGSGFMTRMTDSINNMSASYMMKTRAPEYTVMQEYVQMFAEKLATVERVQQRVLKEQIDYCHQLKEFGLIFRTWANSEDHLNPGLIATYKAIDKCVTALQEQIDSAEILFIQPVKEYVLYADAVKALLKRRDTIQLEYELTAEEINRCKAERDHLRITDQNFSVGAIFGKDPEKIKQQKEEKKEKQIQDLTILVEQLNEKTVCANGDLKADLEHWNKNKREDFKKLFVTLSDRMITYYKKCLSTWEESIVSIHKSIKTDQMAATSFSTMSTEGQDLSH